MDLSVYTPSTQEERDRRYDMLHNFQADRKQFAATFVRGMYHKPQPEQYLEERNRSFAQDADQLGGCHAGRTRGKERPSSRAG